MRLVGGHDTIEGVLVQDWRFGVLFSCNPQTLVLVRNNVLHQQERDREIEPCQWRRQVCSDGFVRCYRCKVGASRSAAEDKPSGKVSIEGMSVPGEPLNVVPDVVGWSGERIFRSETI